MSSFIFPLPFIFVAVLLISESCINSERGMSAPETMEPPTTKELAEVRAVQVTGDPGAYRFNVTVKSPDSGCQQYANWWEIIDREGKLKYRRILTHSHVNEQPFTRSGGPVAVSPSDFLYVRAHMNNSGYGTQVYAGSVENGFQVDSLSSDFAEAIASEEPLPEDCAF